MSSLTHFHSEPLPAGQICQSKGQHHINIISVHSRLSFSCLLLSWLSYLGYGPTGLRLEYSCNGTFASPRSHGYVHVLACSVYISLVGRLFLEELIVCVFAGGILNLE